jgi:hypothetical protein
LHWHFQFPAPRSRNRRRILSARAAGKNGNGLLFDGINDYVNLGNSTYLNPVNQLTIEAWIKPNSISSNQYIVGKDRSGAGGNLQYIIGINSGGSVRFGIRTGTTNAFLNAGNITVGVWTHVAAVYNGTQTFSYRKRGAVL